MSQSIAIGIDVGGTTISAALVPENGQPLETVNWHGDMARGPEAVLDDIINKIDQLLESHGVSRDRVVGIGVGAPGPLSQKRGVIINAANLPGWQDVHICKLLSSKSGYPCVLDNDANAAAYGEYWVGTDKEVEDLVALTLGTGLGSGVILSGKLLHGHFENAAELGHMIVQPGGRLCTCGQCGCLEQYASAGNIARQAAEKVRAGATSKLSEISNGGGELDAKAIAQAAREGDGLAVKIWEEACFYLAVACVNIQHAFNPQMVILGGGMSLAGDFLLDRVGHHIGEQTWKLHDNTPTIALSKLGDRAGVIGAAGIAWQKCEKVCP